MASIGVVREYHADDGWGIIDGPDVPGGCWVHFMAIAMDGYRQLTPGEPVWFHAEAANQDGYAFRALKAWTDSTEPPDLRSDSVAYRSTLTLTFDDPPESWTV